MTISSKPAQRVALASLAVNVAFFVIALLLGKWSGFFAVYAVSWFFLSAGLIWLVLFIQFYQRGLAEQEKLEMGQLARDRDASTIFQTQGERAKLFAVAQGRLDILEKWFLPVFSVAVAAYQVAIGLYLLGTVKQVSLQAVKQPLLCAVCMTAMAFISFLISRYATGMSAQIQWKPLRAGGSFLFATAILSFAMAIGLALAQFEYFIVIKVIDYVLAILLIVVGIETVLNIILDIYRPRLAGQYSRSAFDSRLLGIINEPGEILHTAAGAIDYQFGFKVSQTWFYKLLAKAILPLCLFGALTLYLLSCVVVVNPDEQAIIERFGNPKDHNGQVRLVGAGIHAKYPWPIDIARKYRTKRVKDLYIGFKPRRNPKTGQILPEPLLWGKQHYEEEYDVLVASGQIVAKAAEGAVSVSILKANIPIQYRVNDLYAFLYTYSDYQDTSKKTRPGAEKRLEDICYRELAKFAAGSTIEVDSAEAIRRSLLGAGRATAKTVLTQRIQEQADKAGLGVEIVFLGLQGIHPPMEVAEDYQKVIGAVQKKHASILEAEAELNRTLSALAGSVGNADEIYELAVKYQIAESSGDQQQLETLARQLDSAFASAQGDIFEILSKSQGDAFEKTTLARATGERFASQLKAHSAAPKIYEREQKLTALEDALKSRRKIVVVADPGDQQIFIFDAKEKLTPSLYELGGFEEQ